MLHRKRKKKKRGKERNILTFLPVVGILHGVEKEEEENFRNDVCLTKF